MLGFQSESSRNSLMDDHTDERSKTIEWNVNDSGKRFSSITSKSSHMSEYEFLDESNAEGFP